MTAGRAAALFILLTAAFTWPQVIRPMSVPANIDAYFNMWRVAWIAHQLPIDPAHLFDANIYYPQAGTLLLSDAVLLPALIGLPFIKLGVPVVLVTNAIVFAGFVASGLGMFLLVRELTGRSAAGVLGGIVFAFAPFRFDHYFHLEMGWAQWMPLTLWMVHKTLASGRLKHGLLAGLFVALQGYSSVYYLVFLSAALVIAGPILVSTAAPPVRWRAVKSLLSGALLSAVLLAPYINVYRHAAEATGGRSRQEALLAYGAGPKHYLATMPSSVLYGSTTGTWGQHEKRLFPGFVVMLLVAASLWPPFDRRRIAYALMLAFAVDISFAHRGLLLGWLYDHVFAFRGLRVPPRIAQLMLMAAGVLAGFGLTRLMDVVRDFQYRRGPLHPASQYRRGPLHPASRPRWTTALVAVAVGLTALEYASKPMQLVPVSTTPSAVAAWLATQPPGVVAEFPAPGPISEGIPEVYYQYESTFHWKPLLNGYSGMYPTTYVQWIQSMRGFPDDASIATLVERRASYITLRERFFPAGEYQRVVRALSARRDLVAFGPFPDGGGEARAYRLLSSPK